MTIAISLLAGWLLGFVTFVGYLTFRALRSGEWDTSNVFNVLRLVAFVATHPEVFPYLYDSRHPSTYKQRWPFWYLRKDEFKGVVQTVEERKKDVDPS